MFTYQGMITNDHFEKKVYFYREGKEKGVNEKLHILDGITRSFMVK